MSAELRSRYDEVRRTTVELTRPLSAEDMVVQSMPDASPAKWHLAHTTWFFEEFVLSKRRGFRPFHERYRFLFNSYYDAVGDRHPRPMRGVLSRPSVAELFAYREHVDEQMRAVLQDAPPQVREVVELGLHHEQQHQELLLTDLKHALSCNALQPVYVEGAAAAAERAPTRPARWIDHPGGLLEIGHAGSSFSFDNERPRHRQFLEPFRIAERPVTCGEWLLFMQDGGYSRSELWLSEGWETVRREGWRAPLYWEEREGEWWLFTLGGPRRVAAEEPVCHVSYFEADAYARWAGARLPSEAEWEAVAATRRPTGTFLESRRFHPAPSAQTPSFFGDVWEWTASAYAAYPGFKPVEGALGEYNGKFMCNQYVLRGGSCVTPASHLRATYRNFFPAAARWQFSGVRLAATAA